jgi:iron(III) transport system substrate-binding protein
MSRSMRRLPLLALAAALTLSACGNTSPDVEATEESDGVVTVYSGRNEILVGPLFKQAEQALGLKIDVRYGNTAELAAQMLEEGNQTPADIFFAQDGGALGAVEEAGLFSPLPDEITSRVDAKYRASSGEWVGVTGRARVLVVRPDLADSAPASVYELTDRKWKNQVGIAPTNGSFQSFLTAMRVVDGEERAEQWLNDMKANGAKIFESNSQIVEAVSAGQISIGLVNHYYLYEMEEETGQKLNAELAFTGAGDLGSLVNVAGVGMTTKGAKDPDALALIDFLLSNPAQNFFVETSEYPLIADVPAREELPALSTITPPAVTLEQLSDLEGTLDLLQKVGLV